MQEIIWGSIGCGDVFARKSGPPLYQTPGCSLAGVTRRDAEAGRAVASAHQCRFYDDAASLLADPRIDAVYIATHPDTHRDYTLQVAAADKHVLVEKEMARDADECNEMIAACRAAGVVLGVAFYRRCYPAVLATRTLIADGAIGPVRSLRINDQFPLAHRLDLTHFLLGDLATIAVEIEDLAPTSHATRGPVLHATAASGAEAIMNVGWHESTLVEVFTVEGTTGNIEVADLKAGRMNVTRDGTTMHDDHGGLPYTHHGLIDNFAQHLRGEAPLACPGEDARRSQVCEDLVATLTPGAGAVPVDYR